MEVKMENGGNDGMGADGGGGKAAGKTVKRVYVPDMDQQTAKEVQSKVS